jgi:hypothetical protein
VPRAGDAAVDDLPLPERPVLVLADVRDGGYTVLSAEYRDAFATKAGDVRTGLRKVLDRADVYESVA